MAFDPIMAPIRAMIKPILKLLSLPNINIPDTKELMLTLQLMACGLANFQMPSLTLKLPNFLMPAMMLQLMNVFQDLFDPLSEIHIPNPFLIVEFVTTKGVLQMAMPTPEDYASAAAYIDANTRPDVVAERLTKTIQHLLCMGGTIPLAMTLDPPPVGINMRIKDLGYVDPVTKKKKVIEGEVSLIITFGNDKLDDDHPAKKFSMRVAYHGPEPTKLEEMPDERIAELQALIEQTSEAISDIKLEALAAEHLFPKERAPYNFFWWNAEAVKLYDLYFNLDFIWAAVALDDSIKDTFVDLVGGYQDHLTTYGYVEELQAKKDRVERLIVLKETLTDIETELYGIPASARAIFDTYQKFRQVIEGIGASLDPSMVENQEIFWAFEQYLLDAGTGQLPFDEPLDNPLTPAELANRVIQDMLGVNLIDPDWSLGINEAAWLAMQARARAWYVANVEPLLIPRYPDLAMLTQEPEDA